jgi:CRISPR-associated endonuclease/helicase Cas3
VNDLIARIRQDEHGAHPQALLDHLKGVARRASNMATPFGAEAWARLAGLWHDLGKYRPGFQRYIRETADAHCESTTTPRDKTHSAAGALWAMQALPHQHVGRIFAYLIASHHSGLYDWEDLAARMSGDDARRELAEALVEAPPSLFAIDGFTPNLKTVPGGSAGFHLWLRLLFSTLVDADCLDSEAFMNPERVRQRAAFPSLQALKCSFDDHMQTLVGKAIDAPINRARSEILAQCRTAALLPSGLFSLTVPTGGGKTLSSLAFAFDHARAHGKRRIIYAIPYTSIIEQTADVFRNIFGADNFIEHHSNAEADTSREDHRTRLACENWDAPLIVTTNVQLFESLFAARTARCRKLHNLVGSVIVLDEAQLLPPQFLQPIVDVLKLLVAHYHVTVVLCTATQPALSSRTSFDAARGFSGFDHVAEIIADPAGLYSRLKRAQVNLPADLHASRDWDSLAAEIGAHDSVLSIVSTKKSAYELWRRLPSGAVHLSSLMCGQHRSDVIKRLRQQLDDRRAGHSDLPLRVVSTQLIEAGVDIDFPVVYRALAGLDSVAQAAGRCNREGLEAMGQVHVFVPPIQPPPGLLRKGTDCSKLVWHGHAGDPLDLSLYQRYFHQLYGSCDLDEKGIKPDLTTQGHGDFSFALKLKTVSRKFRLIDDEDTASIIVRYRGESGDCAVVDDLIRTLRTTGPVQSQMRKLQRYTVTLYQRDVLRMVGTGDVAEVFPGIFVQVGDVLYHPILGVNVDGLPGDPAQLVC